MIDLSNKAAQALQADQNAGIALENLPEVIEQLEVKMRSAAKEMEFEKAASLRDQIKLLRNKLLGTK